MRGHFWRNVSLIALAHAVLLVALLRWTGESKAASAPEITWLSGASVETFAAMNAQNTEAETDRTPETAPDESRPDRAAPGPETKSEIVLPNPTPALTPTPPRKIAKPTTEPKPTSKKKITPEPKATSIGKRTITKKKEAAVKTAAVAAIAGRGSVKRDGGKKPTGGAGDGTNSTGSGKSDAATANYYGNMLHDRFYRAWQQPQTVLASGVKLSAIALIRIEKDGRVSDFKIVKPSPNVLVNESVQAVAKKVSQVDALPAGVGSGGHYDVNINFALNSE
jgi:TonB family protein